MQHKSGEVLIYEEVVACLKRKREKLKNVIKKKKEADQSQS